MTCTVVVEMDGDMRISGRNQSTYFTYVLHYNQANDSWSILNHFPCTCSTLAVVHSKLQLTAVGNIYSDVGGTQVVYSINAYPDVLTACYGATALGHGSTIIVAGGIAYWESRVTLVEVIAINKIPLQAKCTNVQSLSYALLVIIGDQLYISSGYSGDTVVVSKLLETRKKVDTLFAQNEMSDLLRDSLYLREYDCGLGVFGGRRTSEDGQLQYKAVHRLLCPQKPQILNLHPRSTTAVISVKIPGVTCSTESPVSCVEISCVCAITNDDTIWELKISCEFKIDPVAGTGDVRVFTMKELFPDSRYRFTVKAKNAEGWSEPSESRRGKTKPFPPKPAKPDRPIIKLCTPTKINLTVQVPQSTCSVNFPIIAWKLTTNEGEVIKYYPLDENDFANQSVVLPVANLNPETQYTLQVLARNENGWSEPSSMFEINTAVLSMPKNLRVSSNRSHSHIKIRWNAPDSILITRYEIEKKTESNTDDCNHEIVKVAADKFSATFTKLKHNTYYYFKIRSCYGLEFSTWSEEIKANTRIHKGIKAALSPLVWAGCTLTAPVSLGVLYGKRMANRPSSSKIAVVAGTVAGVISGAVYPGLLGGTLCAHAFVHGIDRLSDQSDDEETEF